MGNLDVRQLKKVFLLRDIFDYAFRLVLRRNAMVELSEITLEKLLTFSGQSNTLVTIDAPLYGSMMLFNGRVLLKGTSYVEPEKIGTAIGFPAYTNILAEASRFWIVDENGIRRLKGREEMAELLESVPVRVAHS
jgi:hypothetical protein